MNFRFAEPEWLWLLLLLPILAYWTGRVGGRAAIRFSSTALVRQISSFVRSSRGNLVFHARWFSLACFIVALARPQAGQEVTRIAESGIDMMIAIDLSGSMWAHDFEQDGVPLDRLTLVQSVIDAFIEKRAGDRIGLVAFSGDAYLASPLTNDHTWIRRRIADMRLGMIEDGTAIGNALALSIRRLRDIEGDGRVIVLLTDGANNRGQIEPMQAAEVAAALGIRVYTVGVGRPGIVPFPAQFDPVTRQPVRRADGVPVLGRARSDIDLEVLQEIADLTGGAYFHATDTRTLEAIYEEINRLESREAEFDVRRFYRDLFWMPIAAGLGLLLLETILAHTRFRKIP
ncbi:MAG: VWA domain-containing protein [Opitutales bacterium]|nr:VWA domain-containing protein [Opitutales bacterium]